MWKSFQHAVCYRPAFLIPEHLIRCWSPQRCSMVLTQQKIELMFCWNECWNRINGITFLIELLSMQNFNTIDFLAVHWDHHTLSSRLVGIFSVSLWYWICWLSMMFYFICNSSSCISNLFWCIVFFIHRRIQYFFPFWIF